jgi:predicted alpha/beta superfamily hydrolase
MLKTKSSLILAILLLVMFRQVGMSQTKQASGTPLVLGKTYEIDSKILNEKRTINIYLPESYSEKDSLKYPVVYLLDGGMEEDFIHVVGLYQFNGFPWINRVSPSIVVGICNKDRKRDFTFPSSQKEERIKYTTSGHSDAFISFLEKELQPFITSNFKTSSNKTLIGESLGGLLATEVLLKKTTLFDTYIIISPSIWWDDGSLLNVKSDVFDCTYKGKLEVYIGVGKEGLAPCETKHVMEVDANVLADKLKCTGNPAQKIHFDYQPDENHATIAHQAVFNALKWLSLMK